MFKLTIMTGHFASEASGPQKLHKYILRDLYASSLGKKTFLKVSVYRIALNNKYVLTARLSSTHKQQSCSPEWMLSKLSQANTNICSQFF